MSFSPPIPARFPLALVCLLLSLAVLAPTGRAQDDDEDELRTCSESYGTLAVVEPQDAMLRDLRKYELDSPTSLIRIMAQESNCFLVVERGVAMENLRQERQLAEEGELRGGENVGRGQMVAADFVLTPEVLISDDDAGGVGGGIGRVFRRSRAAGVLGGGIKFKEAETSLLVSDTRSGIQVASAKGQARKKDFRLGMLGIGAGTIIGGGGYTDTDEGKVIAASFLDNFNELVASLENNPNMDRFGASGGETVQAGEVFSAGDVVQAKIDNVPLLAEPVAGAQPLSMITATESLVYLGQEKDGHLYVQGPSGTGWINKLLITAR
jgi:hypothetical protein